MGKQHEKEWTRAEMEAQTWAYVVGYRMRIEGQQIEYCDHCGIMIGRPVGLLTTDKQYATVGRDCAETLLSSDPKNAYALGSLKRHIRAEAKAKRDAKVAERMARVEAMLADETIRTRASALPHPKFAGKSLLDWAEWMLANTGDKGRTAVEKALKSIRGL